MSWCKGFRVVLKFMSIYKVRLGSVRDDFWGAVGVYHVKAKKILVFKVFWFLKLFLSNLKHIEQLYLEF